MWNWEAQSSAPWDTYKDSITSVSIGNDVASIGNFAFSDCIGLSTVTVPDGVISIGEYAFYCCTNLTSINIGNSRQSCIWLLFFSDKYNPPQKRNLYWLQCIPKLRKTDQSKGFDKNCGIQWFGVLHRIFG